MSNDTNKYGFQDLASAPENTAMAAAQSQKAVQEIQAALTIAMKNPRNETVAFQRIMRACQRPFLAEHAIYTYPKGGATVSGPSIRLAEVLAQNWGNISAGIRVLSESNGVSEVEAFAWDLETNYQSTKIFHVKHERHTKKGSYKITDPREIYELIANNGSRRLRACILAVIPGDIADAAVEQCEKTLASGQEPIADRIRKLVQAFDGVQVTVEMLEKRLGHNLDVTTESEIVTLRGIFKSIKDGMADRNQFFDIPGAQVETDDEDLIKNKAKPNVTVNKAPTASEVKVMPLSVDSETGEVLPEELQ